MNGFNDNIWVIIQACWDWKIALGDETSIHLWHCGYLLPMFFGQMQYHVCRPLSSHPRKPLPWCFRLRTETFKLFRSTCCFSLELELSGPGSRSAKVDSAWMPVAYHILTWSWGAEYLDRNPLKFETEMVYQIRGGDLLWCLSWTHLVVNIWVPPRRPPSHLYNFIRHTKQTHANPLFLSVSINVNLFRK